MNKTDLLRLNVPHTTNTVTDIQHPLQCIIEADNKRMSAASTIHNTYMNHKDDILNQNKQVCWLLHQHTR